MRKKIAVGFISLAVVLLLAGAISMYELQRLRNQSEQVLALNTQNMEFANRMLTALQTQNSSILRMTLSDTSIPDAGYELGKSAFDEAFSAATASDNAGSDLADVRAANAEYHNVIAAHLYVEDNTEDTDWFLSTYLNAYYRLDNALKSYITSPDNSVQERTRMLESSAYKTITPSILTLLVAIIIVLMFFFFVNRYYVRPLLRIHDSLKNYLSHGVPFSPRFESNDDELQGIKDMIDELIERKKHDNA